MKTQSGNGVSTKIEPDPLSVNGRENIPEADPVGYFAQKAISPIHLQSDAPAR